MKRKYNLVGDKYGRLLVIKKIENTKGKSKYECKCDCGKITIVAGADMITGNTSSCGCLRSEKMSAAASKRNFENRKYEPQIATAKKIFNDDYRDGDLKFEQFLELSQQNCYYCGKEPSNKRKSGVKRNSSYYIKNSEFTYNGLDRINNNLPHNYDNLVACCKYCNYAKRERTVDEFYNWIEILYFNIQKKKDGN